MGRMAYSKLKLVAQSSKNSQPIHSIKIWHENDAITSFALVKDGVNVILMEGKKCQLNLASISNVIFIYNL
jgi:hypothetical protein